MRGSDRDRLFRLAARQAGHFTLAQAQECGFDRAQIRAHEKAGTFARAQPGVYRFVRYPAPSYGEVMAAWLAAGADGVVVSHETALWCIGCRAVLAETCISPWGGRRIAASRPRSVP